jgi:hypothetical protein
VSWCARVATSSADRRAGLTALPPLEEGQGLLLDFPTRGEVCITTAPMQYNIDVLFLDAGGRVTLTGCDRGPRHPLICGEALRVLEVLPQAGCGALRGAQLSGLPPAPEGAAEVAREAPPALEGGWFEPASPPAAAPCRGASGELPRIEGTVTLALAVGEGVSEAELKALTRQLQGFYEPYGLRFEIAGEPARREASAALTAAVADDPGDLFADLRAYLDAYARPPRPGVIQVELLPRIAAPGSLAASYFSELSGLTLSPALAGPLPPEDPYAGLYQAAGLDRPLTPTILLSRDDIAGQHPALSGQVLAHELGHALGLPHVKDFRNLMAADRRRCLGRLDAEQAAAAAANVHAL